MLLVLIGLHQPVMFSAMSSHVCEAGVLLGAVFMGEKLLLFGQTLDPVEARRENRWMLEREKSKGLFLIHKAA